MPDTRAPFAVRLSAPYTYTLQLAGSWRPGKAAASCPNPAPGPVDQPPYCATTDTGAFVSERIGRKGSTISCSEPRQKGINSTIGGGGKCKIWNGEIWCRDPLAPILNP